MKYQSMISIVLAFFTLVTVLIGCAPAKNISADSVPISRAVADSIGYPSEICPESDLSLPQTEAIPEQETEAPIPDQKSAADSAEIAAEPSAESVSSAHIAVPRMSGKERLTAEELLQNAGITYTVTEIYSKEVDLGIVSTLRFYGTVDEESCYINPNFPVELVVSLGPRQRTNVTAVDAKRIYLTFDDGPHHNTDRILEILDTYGIKATFFTVGAYASVYRDRIKAIADAGHLLACHSYSHDYESLYASADSVLNEIHTWEKAIEKAGVPLPETVYFRFPGGTTTSYMESDRFEEIFWAITDAGYYSMDWTCANNDRYLNGKTEEQTLEDYLLQSVIATVGSILYSPSLPKVMLMHDTADETVAMLPQIIEYLLSEGYTFGTLDELDGYWVFR